ncbi:hypothetical protein [Bacillus cereus]
MIVASDGTTNAVIGTIKVGTDPCCFAVNSANNKVYVTNFNIP